MMTMAQKTLQHVMTDPTVDTTLTMVADMVGVSKDMATKIVASGLPMLANVADGDLGVFKAMYAHSVKDLAPPTSACYATAGTNVTACQSMVDEFKSTCGPMTEAITRDAAHRASATEEQ